MSVPSGQREGDSRDRALARRDSDLLADARAATLLDANPMAGMSLLLLVLVLGAGFLWARGAELDEVTRGQGEVIPSSREQIIQSLEGGLLAELLVREGDVVEKGQVLLRIDDTRFSASFRESQSRQASLRAAMARLRAEAEDAALDFPPELGAALVEGERALHAARRQALDESVSSVRRSLRLAEDELAMTAPLVPKGIVSEVEVLRLRRQVNELRGQIQDRRNAFRAAAREDLAAKAAELAALGELNRAREDQVERTIVRAPARGTIQNIRMRTVGGVIGPGTNIMEIIPIGDELLIEARIRPADVAFLRPGLQATVKITAYDFAIYGGLDGTLEQISPDTIADEVTGRESYYRVRVRTSRSYLEGRGARLPIIPGMTATVEVLTGRKTLLEYLVKPLLRARDNALSER